MTVDNSAASQSGNATGNSTGSGVAEKPTWIEQLPEEMRGDESLYSHKTIGEFVKAHKATMSEREGLVKVPGDNATDEERAAFYAKLGRPEKADNYSIKKPDNLPDSIPYDPATEAAFKQFAFESGMSDALAGKIYNWYYGLAIKGDELQRKEAEKAFNDSVDSLKNDWGTKFDENKEVAVRAFKKFGQGFESLLEEKIGSSKLGNHPAFLKLFHSIGRTVMDDKASGGGEGSGQGELSDEEKAKKMFPSMAK